MRGVITEISSRFRGTSGQFACEMRSSPRGVSIRPLLLSFSCCPTTGRCSIAPCSVYRDETTTTATISGTNESRTRGISTPRHDSASFFPSCLRFASFSRNDRRCVRIISGEIMRMATLYVLLSSLETSCEHSVNRRRSAERNSIILKPMTVNFLRPSQIVG